MGKFLENEKINQEKFKHNSAYFSELARESGVYRKKLRSFCLPLENAYENLFSEIRLSALGYFVKVGIKWHDGVKCMTSNHLCDSQVNCVNFLYPFSDKPKALVELFKPFYPDIKKVLPMEDIQDHFIAFEWIGERNYLREKIRPSAKRTRGAYFTSADAAVKFKLKNGQIHIILIEWKYTESYCCTSKEYSKNNTDRKKIYSHIFNEKDCPLNKSLIPYFRDLFYEPFYQLMRQQFLANEMQKAYEQCADKVSILHIAPLCNSDFTKVTSKNLHSLGSNVIDVWKLLIKTQDSFKSLNTEELFCKFPILKYPELENWYAYMQQRYSWLR